MSRAFSSRNAAIGAGPLLLASIAATAVVSASTASGAVVRVVPAATSSTIVARFDNLKGEAAGGASQVSSLNFDVQKSCADCRVVFSGLTISKPVDIATPLLQQDLALGTILKVVNVEVFRPTATGTNKVVTKYQLTNAVVTGDSIVSRTSGQVENVTLTFDTYRILQLAAASNTTTQFSWNVVTNSPTP